MGEFLFHGGAILPAQGDHAPESLLVIGDRIVFVGSLADARRCAKDAGQAPQEIDLSGRAIVPGFIDGHLHPMPMIFFAMSADLSGAHDMTAVGARLHAQQARLAADEWLIGVQFESNRLPAGDVLDAVLLDQWFPDRPVLIYGRDGHGVVVNSVVLAMLSADELASDPAGGTIGCDASGHPDGRFFEKAVRLVQAKTPTPAPNRMLDAMGEVFARLARSGITSIGAMLQSDDEGPAGEAGRLESFIALALPELVAQSIYAIVIGRTLAGVKALASSALNDLRRGTRARAIKIFADGTFGSCTACMNQPYSDRGCTHGYMTLPEDEIYRRMEAAHLAGYQICIHAIGDRGIANCVRLFERLLAEHPQEDHRHRIEHASIADSELIARIARIGLHICSQPLFIRSEMAWLPTRLGEERTGHVYPFRDFLDAGIALAGSSDAPIEDTDVIAAIDFAVNRGGFHPQQGVSVREALDMYTANAARLQFEENDKGSLDAGKLADLVILDRDPLSIPAQDIGTLSVMATMIRGRFVHDLIGVQG
ncbi:amidohydrolase [Mesorhizobium sp.]|jgi:predicted amidohydrolase YtcJ|uniref:amidohydrolase n=1 Tax=Mesorhizobium sp. TaxID=1871066 RepID=UPI002DDD1052|nr:amidohydrolase [Mesorhizobium sp.]